MEEALQKKMPCVIEAVIMQQDLVEPMVAPGAVLDDFVKVQR